MASNSTWTLAVLVLLIHNDISNCVALKNGTTRAGLPANKRGILYRLAHQWKMGAPIKLSKERIQNMTVAEYNILVREIVEDSDGPHLIDVGEFKSHQKLAFDRHYFVGADGKINKEPNAGTGEGLKLKISDRNTRIKPMTSHRRKRASVAEKFLDSVIWGNNVPYTIHVEPGDEFIPWINEGFQMFAEESCVNWQPRQNEIEYVEFLGGDQNGFCAAFIGRLRGRSSPVYLDQVSGNCGARYVVFHEMLHALGIDHEQSRPDRHTYIKINWQCVDGAAVNNFVKKPLATDVDMDWTSIMQYNPNIFNLCDDKGTVETTDPTYDRLLYELVDTLTHYDSRTLVEAYGCDVGCPDICENGGFVRTTVENPTCHCRCPEYLSVPTCSNIISTCGEIIDLDEGATRQIEMNGYPLGDPCIYLIKAPVGNRIIIKQLSINVSCAHPIEYRVNLIDQVGLMICLSSTTEREFVTFPNSESNMAMIILHAEDTTVSPGTGANIEMTAFASDCIDNPCRNGGVCDEDVSTPFFCICPEGYSGDTCNIVSPSATVGCDVRTDIEGICCFTDVSIDTVQLCQVRTQLDKFNPYLLVCPPDESLGAQEALFESNVVFEDGVRCLSFADAVYRGANSNAKVTTTYTENDGTVKLVFETEDTDGFFISRQATLPRYLHKIRFAASRHNGAAGIRDILISPGPCTGDTCASLTFTLCDNGGQCIESSNGALSCDCNNGFTGTYCEIPPDPCASVDCGVNGNCVAGTTSCDCINGYTGPACDEPPPDPCASVDCGVNGNCVAGTTSCDCINGYTGPACDQPPPDPCASVDCGVNGNCVAGTTSCDCINGYTGPACDEPPPDPCASVDCGVNGNCVAGTTSCDCINGYTGPACDQPPPDPCASVDCGVNGNCVAGTTSCDCINGYTGPACDQPPPDPCASVDCGVNGNCVAGTTSCDCINGYTGPACDQPPPDPCASVDCGVNGNCVAGTTSCDCINGYTGPACDEPPPDPCASVDCGVNGNCVAGTTSCDCINGYTGPACDQPPPDPCASVDCGVNGNCVAGTTSCDCINGYTGPACDQPPPDPCTGVDCGVNGNCVVVDNVAGTTLCDCINGYTGPACDQCPPAMKIRCNFERGDKCPFDNIPSSSDRWMFESGTTSQVGTGPYWAYTGTRYLRTGGKERTTTATLKLDKNLCAQEYCMVLNFNMYGKDIVSLTVFHNDMEVFRKDGNNNNRWRTSLIKITAETDSELTIVGTSTDVMGDIAIDDVELLPMSCDKIKICTFETNFSPCITKRPIHWTRRSSRTSTSQTGPSRAHNGYFFAYLQSDRRSFSQLEIPHNFLGEACLSFSYHMYGAHIGSLRVYTKKSTNNRQKIWAKKRDKGNKWLEASIPIADIENTRVFIEAKRAKSEKLGDIAIDTVVLVNDKCS